MVHKHADSVVLEVRRLKEQEGWTTRTILDHMNSLGHELTMTNMQQWISYITRAHLVPK
jgi:hypothetical protein